MPRYNPRAVHGNTREEHRFVHRHLVVNQVSISADGCSLMRLRGYAHKPPALLPLDNSARRQRCGRTVTIHGLTAPAYLLAHVLRVGPDGPLIGPGPWAPIDGDWLNVHPDNWPPTALF